jgi:microcystin-dependent protein
MTLNFPSSPTNGQVFGSFVYDSSLPGWRSNPETAAGMPAGSIVQWPTNTAPVNWLICDGSAISRSANPSLFAAIGTTYGTGNGTTTFNLPDLRGRVSVGRDSGQTEFDILGETGGAKTHTLTTSEMPSHTHAQNSHTHTGTTSTNGAHTHTYGSNTSTAANGTAHGTAFNVNSYTTSSSGNHNHTFTTDAATASNQNTGGGLAHNNLQPYIVLNYIIKTSAGITAGDSELASRVGAVEIGKASISGALFTGNVNVSSSGTLVNGSNGTATFTTSDSGKTPIIAKAASGQTANLQEWLNSSGGINARVDPSGIVVLPNQPSFRAYLLNFGGNPTGTITFNQTQYNIGGHFNQSNGRFTAPISGRYLMSFRAFRNNEQSGNWVVSYFVNGVQYPSRAYDDSDTSNGYGPSTSLVDVISMSANDYVNVVVSTGNIHGNDNAFFSGYFLG